MTTKTDLKALVDNFVSELEAAIEKRVQEEFASKFDELRSELFSGSTASPPAATTRATTRGATDRSAVRRTSPQKAASGSEATKRAGRTKSTGGKRARIRPAELRPCPVSGVLNSARRYSYLMPEHRTPENLAKYRGWTRQEVEQKLEADKKARSRES